MGEDRTLKRMEAVDITMLRLPKCGCKNICMTPRMCLRRLANDYMVEGFRERTGQAGSEAEAFSVADLTRKGAPRQAHTLRRHILSRPLSRLQHRERHSQSFNSASK